MCIDFQYKIQAYHALIKYPRIEAFSCPQAKKYRIRKEINECMTSNLKTNGILLCIADTKCKVLVKFSKINKFHLTPVPLLVCVPTPTHIP